MISGRWFFMPSSGRLTASIIPHNELRKWLSRHLRSVFDQLLGADSEHKPPSTDLRPFSDRYIHPAIIQTFRPMSCLSITKLPPFTSSKFILFISTKAIAWFLIKSYDFSFRPVNHKGQRVDSHGKSISLMCRKTWNYSKRVGLLLPALSFCCCRDLPWYALN